MSWQNQMSYKNIAQFPRTKNTKFYQQKVSVHDTHGMLLQKMVIIIMTKAAVVVADIPLNPSKRIKKLQWKQGPFHHRRSSFLNFFYFYFFLKWKKNHNDDWKFLTLFLFAEKSVCAWHGMENNTMCLYKKKEFLTTKAAAVVTDFMWSLLCKITIFSIRARTSTEAVLCFTHCWMKWKNKHLAVF